MEKKMINLDEIDSRAIALIRDIKTDTEEYNLLDSSIKKNGQHHPITIRRLTEEEQKTAINGAIYGIIDGHHRYAIAHDNGQKEIWAEIDETKSSPIRDMMLAFQLNTTTIRMTPIEKGKVIHDLIKMYEDNGEKKTPKEIGKEVFGLETAMAYRCLQIYKQSIKKTTKKSNADKKSNLDIQKLHAEIERLPRTEKDINSSDVDNCVDQINVIVRIESQLRLYKAMLLEQDGVKAAYKKSKAKK